jgi:hypothetical protein
MVLMNGSKSARNQSAIINRGNTCGGSKKSGLGYTGVGATKGSKSGTIWGRTVNTVFGIRCGEYATRNPTQRIGYRATLGPM